MAGSGVSEEAVAMVRAEAALVVGEGHAVVLPVVWADPCRWCGAFQCCQGWAGLVVV